MTKELVISSNRHETKVAVLEDDQLVEIFFQRSNEYSLVGSIHKGKVSRVLPGMQSAFVELGLERDAFLYVSDFFEESGEEYDRVGTGSDTGRRRAAPPPPPALAPAPAAPPAIILPAPAAQAPERDANGAREGSDANQERRGRRSRRRRSRGRGFPENKYASQEPGGEAVPPAEPEKGIAPSELLEDFEAMVLPGESLAKYRDRSQAEELEASESLAAGIDESAPADEDDAAPESVLRALAAEPEPEPFEDEEAIPGFPAEPVSLEAEPVNLEEEEDSGLVDEEPEEIAASGAPFAVEPAAFRLIEEEFEPFDSDEEEPGAAAAVAAADEEEAGESVEASPEESASDEPGAAPSGQRDPLEADLREQPAARYIVRGSRRVRRRGGRDSRPESGDRPGPGRPEAPAVARAAEPPAVVRPDRERGREREGDRGRERDADRSREREGDRGRERDGDRGRERDGDRGRERDGDRERPPLPSIADLLKEGQEIIIQIAKEPLGQKGARITSRLAIPGRYVVYMPTIDHRGGVSRKISTEDERQRLKRILQTHSEGMTGGFIVRTAGEGRSEPEIAADMNYLYNQWLDIRKKAEKHPAPCLLHHDLELVTRTLRDQASDQFKTIWVDNEETYEAILRFLERFQPSLVSRVKLYTRSTPIFDTFNVTSELEKALRPKMWLKSGGYIVINQTEALVAIDINTGKFVGKSNRLEDTIVKTNVEAIKEIVRQVRLRDLGGIIVVDFIDMDERKNRQKVMQALEEAMRTDRAPYKILAFNDFGLVAITRRRVKQSLERALCSPCPTCESAGYVKSVSTVVGEIINEAYKLAAVVEGADVMLRVHPEVAKFLKANQDHFMEELEEILRRPVIVRSDPLLHPEKFDMV